MQLYRLVLISHLYAWGWNVTVNKIIFWLFISLLNLQILFPAHAQNVSDNALNLKVNELASIFHAIDQVSDSLHDFFQIQDYSEELKPLFNNKISAIFSYKKIRKKYTKIPDGFSEPIQKNSILFAPSIDNFHDPFADAFFTSMNLDDALAKLKDMLTETEISEFKRCFLILSESIEETIKKDSVRLRNIAENFNGYLAEKNVSRHLELMRKFYVSEKREFKSILILWTPVSSNFSGNCYGDHLLVRVPNPNAIDPSTLKIMASVIVHEATHNISANADELQKARLSSEFMQNIKVPLEGHALMLLEEPLVLATQLFFIKNNAPEIYDEAAKFFSNPVSLALLNMLNEYIAQDIEIDERFIVQAAKFYSKSI